MKLWKNAVVICVGGALYLALELIWRGWTHGSMFVVGGLCFWLLDRLRQTRLSFTAQMLLGAAVITALELLSGLLLNRVLGLQVWDYSAAPFNFRGQICLGFSLLWIPVSAMALLAGSVVHRALFAEPPIPRRWV